MDEKGFFKLLLKRRNGAARRFDQELETRLGREMAVLVSDSSGFTRKTHEYGILQFLSVMTRCYARISPMMERRRGRILSRNADNIVAVFPQASDALRAAVEVQRWLRKYNRSRRDAERFNLCIGITSGRALLLKNNVYGPCVNIASKVGEDLADKDEILVTAEVARAAKGLFRAGYARSTTIGGRSFELFKVSY